MTSKYQTEKIDTTSADITEERLAQLRQLLPEAFSEGKVDFDKLRAALGDHVDDRPERYSFTWAGKRDAIRLLQTPTSATLVPARDESIEFDDTSHIFIEGENLEVLKLLYKAYFGQVKMIYIDPPYNTGKDFIYPDNFTDPLGPYLQLIGQKDSEGNLLTSNTDSSGRFHSNWLSMIYPRLFISRQLLRDDGIIFVSIDDREVHNLRLILNEIYGEENHIGTLVWQSKKGGGSDNNTVVSDHEYILCYRKSDSEKTLSRILIEAEPLDREDEKGPYRRGRELNKWGSNSRREDRPTMFFPIPGPNEEPVYPIRNDGEEGCWRWGKKKMMAIVARKDVEFVQRENGTYIVYQKIRSTDPREKPYRTWLPNTGTTADGSKAVKKLFAGKKLFDFPKPIDVLKLLIEMGTNSKNHIILDFFAGSNSLAHAVFEHSKENKISLRFIGVQLPETTSSDSEARKNGFSTISSLAMERIRRVIGELGSEDKGKFEFAQEAQKLNLGFRVFKLAPSHFKPWPGTPGTDPARYNQQLELFRDPLLAGWQPEPVIWEVALKEGYPLHSRITAANVAGHTVYRVQNPDSGQHFHICLEPTLTTDIPRQLQLASDALFICRDLALDDTTAANLALQCRLKTI